MIKKSLRAYITGCETVFAVSDAFLSQHTSKLFLYPVFHRCFGSRLPDGFSSSFHIQLCFSIAGMEDIRKRRELLEKENESSSESDSHWTAEKVRQMLESPPSQK